MHFMRFHVPLQESALVAMLDSCLLTDEEMSQGPEVWATWDDPLPPWLYEDDDEHHDLGQDNDRRSQHGDTGTASAGESVDGPVIDDGDGPP